MTTAKAWIWRKKKRTKCCAVIAVCNDQIQFVLADNKVSVISTALHSTDSIEQMKRKSVPHAHVHTVCKHICRHKLIPAHVLYCILCFLSLHLYAVFWLLLLLLLWIALYMFEYNIILFLAPFHANWLSPNIYSRWKVKCQLFYYSRIGVAVRGNDGSGGGGDGGGTKQMHLQFVHSELKPCRVRQWYCFFARARTRTTNTGRAHQTMFPIIVNYWSMHAIT